MHRAAAWVLAATSAVSTLLAIAASRSADFAPGRLLVFAAWCASFALGVRMIPVIWDQAARFVVTDRHVIWSRGKFKRTMQRDGISYARICWSRRNPQVGDLELVRAIPTGALHRRLTLSLRGLTAPDRVWSIVRGVPTTAAGGNGARPIAQRLDEGELVLWSSRPALTWRAWLPMSIRRALTTALGAGCLAIGIRTLLVAEPVAQRLLEAGIPVTSLAFLTLMGAFGLTVALLVGTAAALLFRGIARTPWLDRRTRYLITNRRVLIQRGRREIHLDRSNIVDVVDSPGRYGGRDVYFVMDGPMSRAFAASGAFGPGEHTQGFVPVLCGVHNLDELRSALSLRPSAWPGRPGAPAQRSVT